MNRFGRFLFIAIAAIVFASCFGDDKFVAVVENNTYEIRERPVRYEYWESVFGNSHFVHDSLFVQIYFVGKIYNRDSVTIHRPVPKFKLFWTQDSVNKDIPLQIATGNIGTFRDSVYSDGIIPDSIIQVGSRRDHYTLGRDFYWAPNRQFVYFLFSFNVPPYVFYKSDIIGVITRDEVLQWIRR